METCFCLRCNAPFVPRERPNPESPYYNYGCTREIDGEVCNDGYIISPEIHNLSDIGDWVIKLNKDAPTGFCLKCGKEYEMVDDIDIACTNTVDGERCCSVDVIDPSYYEYNMENLKKWLLVVGVNKMVEEDKNNTKGVV